MQRYKLVVQYHGNRFIGWQKQKNETKKRSIQSIMECSVKQLSGEEQEMVIAGRTDSGVHAIANCAHVNITRRHKKTREVVAPFSADIVKNGLNFYIKKQTRGIYISQVEAVDQNFHARFSCLERSYVYKIISSVDLSGFPFEEENRWFLNKPLHMEKMREACSLFIGTHDFRSFCCLGEQKKTERTITSLTVEVEKRDSSYGSTDQVFINIYAKAKSFLWHQVRKLVAAIVEVGTGNISLEDLQKILDAKDPQKSPAMAPAHGLYFLGAQYPQYEVMDKSNEKTFKQKNLELKDEEGMPPKKK